MMKLKTSQIGAAVALSAGLLMSMQAHALSVECKANSPARMSCGTPSLGFAKGATVNYTFSVVVDDKYSTGVAKIINNANGVVLKTVTVSTYQQKGSFVINSGTYVAAKITADKARDFKDWSYVYAKVWQ